MAADGTGEDDGGGRLLSLLVDGSGTTKENSLE